MVTDIELRKATVMALQSIAESLAKMANPPIQFTPGPGWCIHGVAYGNYCYGCVEVDVRGRPGRPPNNEYRLEGGY